MRKILGWLVLIIGFFLLGIIVNQILFKKTQPVSPIPNTDEIKVIQISPGNSK